jgi:hypothetical protein
VANEGKGKKRKKKEKNRPPVAMEGKKKIISRHGFSDTNGFCR